MLPRRRRRLPPASRSSTTLQAAPHRRLGRRQEQPPSLHRGFLRGPLPHHRCRLQGKDGQHCWQKTQARNLGYRSPSHLSSVSIFLSTRRNTPFLTFYLYPYKILCRFTEISVVHVVYDGSIIFYGYKCIYFLWLWVVENSFPCLPLILFWLVLVLFLSFTADNKQHSYTTIIESFICYLYAAGQERFRTLTSSYYRGAQGIIMGKRESCQPVTKKEGIEFAREYGCLFLECSAKTKVNVEQCFEEHVLKILDTPSLLADASSGAKKNIKQKQPEADAAASSCC